MNYYIYCKDKYMKTAHQDAIKEYGKRLSSYCKIQCIIGAKKIVPDNFTTGNHQIILISKGLSTISSEEFADNIRSMEASGKSNIHIYIGYEQQQLKEAYSSKENVTLQILSITNSEISNQTLCVLLLEQIYRAYTIIRGKTYHK